MNLVTDPWIPVIMNEGTMGLVSLDNLFRQGASIRDLAVNPVQRIALMRLLICIAQAALDGPEDEENWHNSEARIPAAGIEYLHKWHGRFELYGDRPFLQAADLAPLDNATLDKLDFGLSAGNNSTLFDHGASPLGRAHDDAWRALALLTYQSFSPGGLIGVTEWAGQQTTKTSEHAPTVEGAALHTLILGNTLMQTIWMNTIPKDRIRELPNMSFGTPAWELEMTPAELDAAELTSSYLGRLVPLSRAIRLEEHAQTFTLANGLPYPKLPAQRDPMATVVRRGRGKAERDMYVGVNLNRHPWRELASVAALPTRSLLGGPLALKHLKYFAEDLVVDIWTGGMATDKAKILDVAEWVFSVPLSLLDEPALLCYEQGITLARRGEAALRDSVKTYYTTMHVDARQIPHGSAETHYWSNLDQQFPVLLETACSGTHSLDATWCPILLSAMKNAFEHACPHVTPRQIMAFAKAREKLILKQMSDASSD